MIIFFEQWYYRNLLWPQFLALELGSRLLHSPSPQHPDYTKHEHGANGREMLQGRNFIRPLSTMTLTFDQETCSNPTHFKGEVWARFVQRRRKNVRIFLSRSDMNPKFNIETYFKVLANPCPKMGVKVLNTSPLCMTPSTENRYHIWRIKLKLEILREKKADGAISISTNYFALADSSFNHQLYKYYMIYVGAL